MPAGSRVLDHALPGPATEISEYDFHAQAAPVAMPAVKQVLGRAGIIFWDVPSATWT